MEIVRKGRGKGMKEIEGEMRTENKKRKKGERENKKGAVSNQLYRLQKRGESLYFKRLPLTINIPLFNGISNQIQISVTFLCMRFQGTQ